MGTSNDAMGPEAILPLVEQLTGSLDHAGMAAEVTVRIVFKQNAGEISIVGRTSALKTIDKPPA